MYYGVSLKTIQRRRTGTGTRYNPSKSKNQATAANTPASIRFQTPGPTRQDTPLREHISSSSVRSTPGTTFRQPTRPKTVRTQQGRVQPGQMGQGMSTPQGPPSSPTPGHSQPTPSVGKPTSKTLDPFGPEEEDISEASEGEAPDTSRFARRLKTLVDWHFQSEEEDEEDDMVERPASKVTTASEAASADRTASGTQETRPSSAAVDPSKVCVKCAKALTSDTPTLKRRRGKMSRDDIQEFLDYLKDRNLKIGLLLSVLLAKDCPMPDLRASITKWKRGSAAAALVNDLTYSACLSRVCTKLSKEAGKLSQNDYLRSHTGRLSEEDILNYNPRKSLNLIKDSETMFAVLMAMEGVDSEKDPSCRSKAKKKSAPQQKMPATNPITMDIDEQRTSGVEPAHTPPIPSRRRFGQGDLPSSPPQPLFQLPDVQEHISNSRAAAERIQGGIEVIELERDQFEEVDPPVVEIKRRRGQRDKCIVALFAAMCLLFGRTRRCNRLQLLVGLYLYGSRTSRRTIEVLSRAGICTSFLTIKRAAKALAIDAQATLRKLVADPKTHWVLGYDNLNWQDSPKDKTVKVKNKMRAAVHGNIHVVEWEVAYKEETVRDPRCSDQLFRKTFGTKINRPTTEPQPLFDLVEGPTLSPSALWQERDRLRKSALPETMTPQTTFAGVEETTHLATSILSHLYHAYVDAHADLSHLKDGIPNAPAVLPLKPKRSNIRPLPVVDRDEATVKGNIDAIHDYIGYMDVSSEDLSERVVEVIADVYTVQKCNQAGHRRREDRDPESPDLEQMKFVQAWPAWFHTQMALTNSIVSNHLGTPGTPDPFSIRSLYVAAGYSNLHTTPLVYHDCQRFIVVLFAALAESILTPELYKRGHVSVKGQYSRGKRLPLTFEAFDTIARPILAPMLNEETEVISWDQEDESSDQPDDVFLHGVVLLRECGLFIEFGDAIRQGDIGRIVICLRQMVTLFQAGGQHNYVIAITEVLIDIDFELPPALVLRFLGGSLVNRDGRAGNFVPLDLHQEQDILALKSTFPLHGANGGIDNKAMLGAIIHLLRMILHSLNYAMGISSTNNAHSKRSTTETIIEVAARIVKGHGFVWRGGRTSTAFELPKGATTKRYSATKATDHYAAGMMALWGSRGRASVWEGIVRRHGVRLKKDGRVRTHEMNEMETEQDEEFWGALDDFINGKESNMDSTTALEESAFDALEEDQELVEAPSE